MTISLTALLFRCEIANRWLRTPSDRLKSHVSKNLCRVLVPCYYVFTQLHEYGYILLVSHQDDVLTDMVVMTIGKLYLYYFWPHKFEIVYYRGMVLSAIIQHEVRVRLYDGRDFPPNFKNRWFNNHYCCYCANIGNQLCNVMHNYSGCIRYRLSFTEGILVSSNTPSFRGTWAKNEEFGSFRAPAGMETPSL